MLLVFVAMRCWRGALAFVTLALVVAVASARVAQNRTSLITNRTKASILDNTNERLRVDCAPDPNIIEDVCRKRGCLWTPVAEPNEANTPYCHFPSDSTGYRVADEESDGLRLSKAANSPNNPFGGDTLDIHYKQYSMGAGVRIVLGTDNSYVPDVQLERGASIESIEQLDVETATNSGIWSFAVKRKTSGVPIWDTSIGAMLFGRQYLQLATHIPTTRIYGFGEHTHLSLKHDLTKYKTWPMFTRDQPPNANDENTMNLYGVHNFYIGLEKDGNAHGVFVLNTHAQEVTTGPGPHLIYRAIGGQFEIFFLPGPTPEEVIKQYQQIIYKPYLPPWHALGYQLCRYGFQGLDDLKATVDRIRDAGIPFDTIQADIDYMDRYKDFTVDGNKWSGFGDYARTLLRQGLHVTTMIDPAIQVDYDAFQRARDQGANFISWPRSDLVQRENNDKYPLTQGTQTMLGVVWPDRHVGFPDFWDDTNATRNWWISEIRRFQQNVPIDGLWIDMNEPSSFSTNDDNPWYCNSPDHPCDKPLWCPTSGPDSSLDMPSYHTKAAYQFGGYSTPLAQNTLCMLATGNRGKLTLYETKSTYGLRETIDSRDAMTQILGKRAQLISRSTFPTSGKYGGHWLGDNTAGWPWLKSSIVGAQEFNMFGINHVGSDVCGFIGDTWEELCVRWHQLGAFHSFYRNHNDVKSKPQDPPQWKNVAIATREANFFRYAHLPYLYSLHFAAAKNGGTVVRPLFFEFPHDSGADWRGYEFMFGPAMLVAPVYYEGTSDSPPNFYVYLPPEAVWYKLYGVNYGARVESGNFDTPWFSSAPVYARGGFVIPRQEPSVTTMATHQNNLRLLVATDAAGNASGELYWDDGEALNSLNDNEHMEFTFAYTQTETGGQLDIVTRMKQNDFDVLPLVEEIEVLGYPSDVNISSVAVNERVAHLSEADSGYNSKQRILTLKRPQAGFINLNELRDKWSVTWRNV